MGAALDDAATGAPSLRGLGTHGIVRVVASQGGTAVAWPLPLARTTPEGEDSGRFASTIIRVDRHVGQPDGARHEGSRRGGAAGQPSADNPQAI